VRGLGGGGHSWAGGGAGGGGGLGVYGGVMGWGVGKPWMEGDSL